VDLSWLSASGVVALPDPGTLVALCVAAAMAGWVDAVSGGGGLLQLPAIMLLLPGASPVQALATNKLSSILGTASAAATYSRKAPPDVRTALPMAAAAFVGAAIGATVASSVPAQVFRPVIVALLVVVWFWTLLSPQLGRTQALRWHGRRRHYAVATGAGLAIGCYDGMIGPGTGSFLLIVLVAGLGYSFLNASSTAKVVNLGTNLAALIVFGLTGSVLWGLGLVMGVCNVAGAVVGARMAIRRGSGFVRVVFLAVVGLLILRLGWSLLP
jgi:uncharacterized membrane protein YfcA